MLPHCSIILISFHRGTGSGAYGMEDALQSGNLLTESITHMWQHVLSWEDSRGRGRERGASVSLTSPVMISAFIGPSSEPPFFLWCVGELRCVPLFLYHCLHSCQRHRPPYTPYTSDEPVDKGGWGWGGEELSMMREKPSTVEIWCQWGGHWFGWCLVLG